MPQAMFHDQCPDGGEMTAKMILTGDVNLMNVTDPSVPFAQVADEFHRADVVFSNLECCLDIPAAHSVSNEGFFADPRAGEALRRAGIHAVGIGNNVHYGAIEYPLRDRVPRRVRRPPHRRRKGPCGGAGAGDRRAQRHALRLPPAQLGVLADRSRGSQGRDWDRRHSRPHRLSCAGVQDPNRRAAAEPSGGSAGDRHLGRRGLSRTVSRGSRGGAAPCRCPGGVLPLGARPGRPQIHDGDRPCGDRCRRRPRDRSRAALLPADRGLQGPAHLLRPRQLLVPHRPRRTAASPTGSA